MDAEEKQEIIFVEKPGESDFLVFSKEHQGCDMIVSRKTVSDPRHARIYAYASSMAANRLLYDVFRRKYNDGQYLLMRHVSERQAFGIV